MSQKTHPSIAPEEIGEIQEALSDLKSQGSLIYETKGQAIHRFQTKNRDLIAKSYQLNTLAQKAAALFKRSRAHRSFRAGTLFLNADIKTPTPLLLLENGNLTPTSVVLVTEYCPFPALRESIVREDPVHPSTPEKILRLLHQLSNTDCSHGDFHSRNLLVDEDGNPHLIDLDGVKHHTSSTNLSKYIREDRDRFLRSLEPLPEHHQQYSIILGESGSPLPAINHAK